MQCIRICGSSVPTERFVYPINKDNNNPLKKTSKMISVQGLTGPPHNLQLGGNQAVRRLRNSFRLTLHPYPVTPPIERYLPMLRELGFLSANDSDKKNGGTEKHLQQTQRT